MKKFLACLFMVTLTAIIYVNQHTRLIECSYSLNSNEKYLSLLIDRNQYLRYNISKLESPARLEEAGVNKDNIGYPATADLYKIRVKEDIYKPSELTVQAPVGFFAAAGRTFLSRFALDVEAIANEPGK